MMMNRDGSTDITTALAVALLAMDFMECDISHYHFLNSPKPHDKFYLISYSLSFSAGAYVLKLKSGYILVFRAPDLPPVGSFPKTSHLAYWWPSGSAT